MDQRSVEVVTNLIRTTSARLVLIMGPGAVGKSHFAHQLQSLLITYGHTANIVELDGFLLDRKIRMKNGWVTAHNPKGFNLNRINSTLHKLVFEKKPQTVNILDKSVSKVVGTQMLDPADHVIVEGTISFYLDAAHYAGVRIYITAPKAVQFSNRLKRESVEIGYTEEVSRARFMHYWRDYMLFVRPKRKMANVKMIVNGNYIARLACREDMISR
jgi:uridine kinase